MRQFRTTSSPFKQQTHYKPAELESMCLDELRKAKLIPVDPEPIRIEEFITKRFGVTPDYNAPLPDGILGLTRFGNKGPTDVLIARSLGEDVSDVGRRRTNATLAHEAGHCLLHGYLFALSGRKKASYLGRSAGTIQTADGIDLKDQSFLCRDTGQNISGHGWWEWQADAMIGPLLMPLPLVMRFLKLEYGIDHVPSSAKRTVLTAPDTFTVYKKMAETFDVNPAAARIRLEKTGVSITMNPS